MGYFFELGWAETDHLDEDEVLRPHAGPLVAGDAHQAVFRDRADPKLVGDPPDRS